MASSIRLFVALCLAWGGVSCASAADEPPAEVGVTLVSATEHRLRGRYEEALEAYEALLKSTDPSEADRIAIWLGESRIHEETGKWEEADEVIAAALSAVPKSAALLARQGELGLLRGRYAEALDLAKAALEQDSDHVHSRLIHAQALAETGQLDEAATAFRWFIQYYNRKQPTDAETLLYVAEGAVQHARWSRTSSVFRFVVNDVCPDALKDDKYRWQSPLISGHLLLEKFNESQAIPEFHNALRINPQVAEIHAAMGMAFLQDHKLDQARERAEQALAKNARSTIALALMADLYLAQDEPAPAREWIDKALAINPADQRLLGRKAALSLLESRRTSPELIAAAIRNLPTPPDDEALPVEFRESVAKALRITPKPGEMLAIIGQVLETHRKFDTAEVCYRRAIELMPQLIAPRTQLGMLCMRTGQVDEAETILNEAFAADPFHVRISNMRKVIGVLKTYDTITTEHFVIRIDAEQNLLGHAMADYLEQVYPELTQKFGFEPPQRTQFEIYCNAKGQPAHAWFSSRMIGLPWIQTIGASTGVMVALTSPNQSQRPFHWGHVLRHEFAHVITLQATTFNIPHWYTEALAVRNEGTPFRPEWEELLLVREPQGDLFNLDTINDGFRKPKSPDHWTLAYCQATLYADYLEQTYGANANPRLLTAYREGRTTREALLELFQVEQEPFEKGYRDFLSARVKTFTAGRAAAIPDLKTAEELHKKKPDDLRAADDYVFAQLRSRRVPQARKLADELLKKDSTLPLSNIVVALMEARAGKSDEALDRLVKLRDDGETHRELLAALTSMAGQAKQWQIVADTARFGRETYPRDPLFVNAAAKACEELKQPDELGAILELLVVLDTDDPAARRKLAKIKLDAGDAEAAKRWAGDSLLIDVTSAEAHELLGRASVHLMDWKTAERAFSTALELDGMRVESKVGLAETYLNTERKTQARELVEGVLKTQPEHQRAKAILERVR